MSTYVTQQVSPRPVATGQGVGAVCNNGNQSVSEKWHESCHTNQFHTMLNTSADLFTNNNNSTSTENVSSDPIFQSAIVKRSFYPAPQENSRITENTIVQRPSRHDFTDRAEGSRVHNIATGQQFNKQITHQTTYCCEILPALTDRSAGSAPASLDRY